MASDDIDPACYATRMHAPAPKIIQPEVLLLAYRSGIFPMADSREDTEVFWVEPRHRAILPLDGFHCSKSLAKLIRQDRFTIRMDGDFAGVINACSQPRIDHPESWISQTIMASYRNLHRFGHAHSVECWDGEELVGGLYGVAFDRVFCGESMFTLRANASKVALAWLVALLRRAGFRLLDCQFMTDHLASLGAVEITRDHYLELLGEACAAPPRLTLPAALEELYVVSGADSASGSGAGSEAGAGVAGAGVAGADREDDRDTAVSSPGKLIAQSFTQTS